MDWFDFAIRAGLPTAALAATAWFVAARVWPFITSAWQEQQRERREEREKYLASLEKQGEMFKTILAEGERIRQAERDRFLEALARHQQRKTRGGQDKKE